MVMVVRQDTCGPPTHVSAIDQKQEEATAMASPPRISCLITSSSAAFFPFIYGWDGMEELHGNRREEEGDTSENQNLGLNPGLGMGPVRFRLGSVRFGFLALKPN